MRKIKLFIAGLLDRLFPGYCRLNLILWAKGMDDFENRHAQICRVTFAGTPYAYCGKCEENGRYYLKEPK